MHVQVGSVGLNWRIVIDGSKVALVVFGIIRQVRGSIRLDLNLKPFMVAVISV